MKRAYSILLMMALTLSATSCLQPPSATDDNGPAVDVSLVQEAIIKAWDNADFSTTLLDEYMYLEQDQKISNLEPRVVYKESKQITGRRVDPEDARFLRYTMLIRSTSLENGTFKPITSSEDELSALYTEREVTTPSTSAKPATLANSVEALQKSMQTGNVGLMSEESRNHFLGIDAVRNMLRACIPMEGWDVTCHNLQVTEGLRSAPTGVASQPGCGGLQDCQVRFKKVSFELVVNLPASEEQAARTEKMVYELVFSPDVPYLSRLMDFCFQGMVPTANQKVLIKICNRIQNFQRGEDVIQPPLQN